MTQTYSSRSSKDTKQKECMNLNDSRSQAVLVLSAVAIVSVIFLIAYALRISEEREREKNYIKTLAWGGHLIPHPRPPEPIQPKGPAHCEDCDVGR